MSSEFDQKPPVVLARTQQQALLMASQLSSNKQQQQQPDSLPCPRCDSTRTKFCYYNNYNLSQPRHFCKSCRRYWTQGGTLRNIPVGGGTRKSSTAKRFRSSSSSSSTTTTTTNNPDSSGNGETSLSDSAPVSLEPVSFFPGSGKQEMGLREVNLNESLIPETENEAFAPLLSLQGQSYLTLGGYGYGYGNGYGHGYGLGSGFDEMGSTGFNGRGINWPFPNDPGTSYLAGVGSGNGSGPTETTASGVAEASGCNTWQMSDLDGGDCFPWPGVEISMPGKRG